MGKKQELTKHIFGVFVWLGSGILPGENFVYDSIWFQLLAKKKKKDENMLLIKCCLFKFGRTKNMSIALLSTNKQHWWGEQKSIHRFQKIYSCLFSVEIWLMSIRRRSVLVILIKSPMSDGHLPWDCLKIQHCALMYLFPKSLNSIHSLKMIVLYLSQLFPLLSEVMFYLQRTDTA